MLRRTHLQQGSPDKVKHDHGVFAAVEAHRELIEPGRNEVVGRQAVSVWSSVLGRQVIPIKIEGTLDHFHRCVHRLVWVAAHRAEDPVWSAPLYGKWMASASRESRKGPEVFAMRVMSTSRATRAAE